MRAGILTFHQVNNYGAVLQNYALQKALQKCGCEAVTIDYCCDYIGRPYRPVNLKKKGLLSYLMGISGHIIYQFRSGNTKKFRKQLSMTSPIGREELPQLNDAFDVFITGSDQVWNYKLTNMDPTYFLDFVKASNKKASYAASIGLSEIEGEYAEKYQKLLNSFRLLSVREENGAEIIRKILGKKPQVVADPTVLLSGEEWLQVAKFPDEKQDYILVYQLSFSARALDFAELLAKRAHCKIICLPFPMGKWIPCQWGLTKGPAEFLGLMKNAKYIVTSSYHGIIFSILFKKEFYIDLPEGIRQVRSRVENLLNEFDLRDRTLEHDMKDLLKRPPVDYLKMESILKEKRKTSMDYLRMIVSER